MEQWIKQIETDGYCKIPQVYDQEKIQAAKELILNLFEETKHRLSDNVPFLNRNQPMVYNLQNKDYTLLKLLFQSNDIQDILIHFLNDIWFKQIPSHEPNYILRSFLARSSNLPLPLHIDSFVPYEGDQVFVMQVSIVLEDQNKENGCTFVVPGSHHFGEFASQSAFKDAVAIESKAGDVVIWDSRLWHGTKENSGDKTRWAMIATFCRWWLKQGFDFPRNLPQNIYQQLTDNQKAILGFCSIAYNDESEGIDMKRGYDSLADDVSVYRNR